MKFILGFVLGIMTLSAFAEVSSLPVNVVSFLRAGGDDQDGKGHVIQTDRYGYVICSQLPPPTHFRHGMPPGNDLNPHEK